MGIKVIFSIWIVYSDSAIVEQTGRYLEDSYFLRCPNQDLCKEILPGPLVIDELIPSEVIDNIPGQFVCLAGRFQQLHDFIQMQWIAKLLYQ